MEAIRAQGQAVDVEENEVVGFNGISAFLAVVAVDVEERISFGQCAISHSLLSGVRAN